MASTVHHLPLAPRLSPEIAARLETLLGVPLELFLGEPGETTEERLAREAAAQDLLEVDPFLSVRAQMLARRLATATEAVVELPTPGLRELRAAEIDTAAEHMAVLGRAA